MKMKLISTEERLLSELPRDADYERMTMPWISTEERLPEDLHEVMFFIINEEGQGEIIIGHRHGPFWYHCCLYYSSVELQNVKVTHWVELPNYPGMRE
jgi:hypothetical protein